MASRLAGERPTPLPSPHAPPAGDLAAPPSAAPASAPRASLAALTRSPAVRAAIAYGGGGIAFAVANLVLARQLAPAEFGRLALLLSLLNLSGGLAPLGIDGAVVRRMLRPTPALARATVGAGLVVAAAAVLVGWVGYTLPPRALLLLGLGVVGGGLTWVAAAVFQSSATFGRALPLTQSENVLVALAAAAAILGGVGTMWVPLFIVTVGRFATAAVGWHWLREARAAATADPASPRLDWRDALSFAGVHAAGLVLMQLDRLLIPHSLPISDLATFAVLAAIVGSPFRVLQLGAGFTLLPRLRAAQGVAERRRLLARESLLLLALVLVASAAIWLLTPLVLRWLLAGKYVIGSALMLAALVAGTGKIVDAVAKAVVSAVGTTRELGWLNALGWGGVVLALVAGVLGARGGLAGLVLGVGAGWWARALAAAWIARRHLRDDAR